jgi:hypothetical protein
MSLDLFSGIRVGDFGSARDWYAALFGAEPSFLPHPTEAVWELAEHRYVYIEEHPDRPGGTELTLFVDDLDERVAGIAARGIEPTSRETYENGVRKVTYVDADGNEIGWGGAPLS